MKKKLLCPRNEVCVFFLTDYISFLVSPTYRRLAPLSHAVSDDWVWAFTHLHLPLFLLFIFFFFLKLSVALQPGWPGTHDVTHPGLRFFVLLLPKLPCAGIDYRDILGFIFVFNYYDVFLKSPPVFTDTISDYTRRAGCPERFKVLLGVIQPAVAVPRIFCWICRCMDP